MIKCSKCGAECNDKALFCSSCGKSLDEEREEILSRTRMYKCPKCGATYKGKRAFCEKCGSELVADNEPAKEEAQPVEEVQQSGAMAKATKIINIILYSFSFLVILLSLISVWLDFGSFASVYTMGEFPSELGLKMFFKNLFESERYTATYIVSFLTFFVALVMTYTYGIISLVKQIKSGTKKEFKICTKPLCSAAITPLMYHILSYAIMFVKEEAYGISVKEELGAGFKMSLVAVSFLFVIIVVYHVFNDIKSKKQILPSVFKCVVALLLLIVARYTFIGTRELDVASSMTAKVNPTYLLFNNWSYATYNETVLTDAFIDMFMQDACIVVLVSALMTVFSGLGDKKGNSSRIGLTSVALGMEFTYLLVYAITKESIERMAGSELILGGNFIAGLLLTMVALGLSIATACIESKIKKAE